MSNKKKAWSTPRVSVIPSASARLERFRGVALNATQQKKLDRMDNEMRRGRSRSVAA